jgi:TrmH family RNA methyltransferase
MKYIESRNNPIIKRALKAISNPSAENLIVVEGHKLLGEAIKSGAKPEMIFVTTEESGLLSNHSSLSNTKHCSLLSQPNGCQLPQSKTFGEHLVEITYKISKGLMRELSTVQTPNEVIAFLTPSPSPELEDVVTKAEMLVVLDRLQDPGNIGTIMRTSEAMGVSAIILLKGCCNPNNHKVIRAAMGSSFRLPVIANVDVENLFSILNKNGYMTICADMRGTTLKNFKFAEKSALFMGQEGRGLSDFIIDKCKSRIAIPMCGEVESLNVATSAAMCLYEWARNRFEK